jgi:hypothetical protein
VGSEILTAAVFASGAANRLHREALDASGSARIFLFRERDEAEAWLRKILASMSAEEWREWTRARRPRTRAA